MQTLTLHEPIAKKVKIFEQEKKSKELEKEWLEIQLGGPTKNFTLNFIRPNEL